MVFGGRPPTRWTEYSMMKDVVAGTRFLPFRTPFVNPVTNSQGVEERFTPSIVLEKAGNLGCVINLTQSDRYYDPKTFQSKGITVIRKALKGDSEIPDPGTIKEIFSHIDNFIKNNQDDTTKLIGVHCTHGVNRTGYIICRYMINRLGKTPQEALDAFQGSRGHEMDHPEQVDDLFNHQPAISPSAKDWHSVRVPIMPGQKIVTPSINLDIINAALLRTKGAAGIPFRTQQGAGKVSGATAPKISPAVASLPKSMAPKDRADERESSLLGTRKAVHHDLSPRYGNILGPSKDYHKWMKASNS